MEFEISDRKVQLKEKFIVESSEEVRRQIKGYLNSEREKFELDIEFPDSFTGEVMKKMSEIPYGETRSYEDIARKLETAPIAVGQACGRNPLPLIISCHRVTGKNSIGGYRYGEEVKRKLLDLESERTDNR